MNFCFQLLLYCGFFQSFCIFYTLDSCTFCVLYVFFFFIFSSFLFLFGSFFYILPMYQGSALFLRLSIKLCYIYKEKSQYAVLLRMQCWKSSLNHMFEVKSIWCFVFWRKFSWRSICCAEVPIKCFFLSVAYCFEQIFYWCRDQKVCYQLVLSVKRDREIFRSIILVLLDFSGTFGGCCSLFLCQSDDAEYCGRLVSLLGLEYWWWKAVSGEFGWRATQGLLSERRIFV